MADFASLHRGRAQLCRTCAGAAIRLPLSQI
jgi:hypothetical protein